VARSMMPNCGDLPAAGLWSAKDKVTSSVLADRLSVLVPFDTEDQELL